MTLRDVKFSYGARPVLRDVNLTVPRGKVVAIMGGSGCGKTTILRLIGGQLRPTAGDVLVAITTSGTSPNVLAAVKAAHEREMTVIALTGKGGGKMSASLRETDIHICVPHDRTSRIQEVHLLALHCLCEGVDNQLLGEKES